MPNPNYNQIITIYNRYKNNGTETWKRTVLHDCFFKCETHTSWTGTGAASKSNTYTVRIPKHKDFSDQTYFNLTGLGWTLREGDLCILGDCQEVITGASGHTATDVLKKYKPNAFKISTVSANTAFIGAHYRIGG